MAFVQANVNYAVDYSRELANAYPYLSYFGALYGAQNSSKYRPVMGKTVAIPSLEVSGAKAVNRNQITGTFNRNWNNAWQTKELSMDRDWDTLIDPLDMVETNDVATIANSKADTTALTAANILTQWDTYLAALADARINRDRVIAYIIPSVYKLLKEAAGITRFIDAGTGIRNVDRNVGKLDGVTIVEVPGLRLSRNF